MRNNFEMTDNIWSRQLYGDVDDECSELCLRLVMPADMRYLGVGSREICTTKSYTHRLTGFKPDHFSGDVYPDIQNDVPTVTYQCAHQVNVTNVFANAVGGSPSFVIIIFQQYPPKLLFDHYHRAVHIFDLDLTR